MGAACATVARAMEVALFVPCYIDQLYPRVGLATAELLERNGVTVHFPEAQTCCGQPMANSGFFDDARQLARKMLDVFSPYEHVVCPSGSCTSVSREDPGALRVPARRASSPPARPLRRQGRPPPELPRPARAAPGQRQRASRPRLLEDRDAAGRHRRPETRRADAIGRVLRIRRYLHHDGRGNLLRDGARPHRGPRARRRRNDHWRRQLLLDASGRPAPTRRQEVARPARGRIAGGSDPMSDHAARAAEFVADQSRMHWHDQAVWFIRSKRDVARSFVPEWEELRSLGSQIKAHTLSRLPDYLEEFEKNAVAAGARVHWARDADEHNRIVHGILRDHGVARLVKSKSMLTEECHLNEYLEEHGVEVVDTDLGERIVQFRREPPSHIVMPAIHLKKEEIGELFPEKLGPPAGLSDPPQLTGAP